MGHTTRMLLLLIVFVASCGGFQGFHDREENDRGPDMEPDMRTGMMQYIVHKGCDYVSAFVWSHYMHHHYHDTEHSDRRYLLTTSNKCSWQDTVMRYFMSAHVPQELAHALLDCGATYSFHAVGLRDMSQTKCNMSHHDSHDHVATFVGKRGVSEWHGKIARHQTVMSNMPLGPPMHHENTNGPEKGIIGPVDPSHGQPGRNNADLQHPSAEPLLRWCTSYSRQINSRFRLHTKLFQKTSRYWLVDVYRMAEKFKTPEAYIHGLVGCGQKYALGAFGVPHWMSLSYGRV